MKNNRRNILRTCADVLVTATLILLHPLGPFAPTAPVTIPDKVEIYCRPVLSADSLQKLSQLTTQETEELEYYMRVHNVTDEGYNMIARYYTELQQQQKRIKDCLQEDYQHQKDAVRRRFVKAKDRPLTAVKTAGGYWKAGRFRIGPLYGEGIMRDRQGRIVCALWDCDTIVNGSHSDSQGTYRGQMDRYGMANGQGTYDGNDGSHYEGLWQDDQQHGFGFQSSPHHPVRIGQWQYGRFLGEKLRYTPDRIYGIDISRHQHEKGRRRFGINWNKLRITSLGHRHDTEGHTYPVSFVYIKSTEGTSIRNKYFVNDYAKAKKRGVHVGAYHFFSTRTSAQEQATWFMRNTLIRKDDFPPVLDVEPSDAQISQIGGGEELLRRVRQWLQLVERGTGKRPILYINQMFINRYMQKAADIKKRYNVWIARYGEYKPDVRLVYWQLTPDGRVDGITGPVDINVFNGYQGQFDEFVRTGFHQ